MTDLEIIKQQLAIGIGSIDWEGEFDGRAYRNIIEAAERMAAEIDRLKATLADCKTLIDLQERQISIGGEMSDNTSVKNICESIKDLLDRKPVDEWKEKVAKMIGYVREGE